MTAAKPPRKRKTTEAEIQSVAACLDELCVWLEQGRPLSEFCRQPGRPAVARIYDATYSDASIAGRIARARDVGHDVIAEDTLRIIDERPESVVGEGGAARLDPAYVTWQRNRVDQRLKLLAKWNPKKYGDKQEIEHKGNMTVTFTKDDEGVL